MALRLQVLGPLRVWRDDVEVDLGPRQQAYVLALLLARAGQPVGTDELVDLVWEGSAPPSARNAVHKYLGALRRLLEPALPARRPGSYLLRRGRSYVCVAGPGVLDLVTFRGLVRDACAAGRTPAALDRYAEALGLWSGPAGDGFAPGPAAVPTFAGLDDEFLDAVVAAGDLAVALGRPERVLPALQRAATMAPLHEPVQAALVAALGAAGHRAEALGLYRTVRERLVTTLDVQPGAALRAALDRVLHASPPPAPAPAARCGTVGRADELALLRSVLERARAGRPGVVLVEGEPGVGKTRLLDELAAEARRRDALAVRVRCADGDGAPPTWPWMQALRTAGQPTDGVGPVSVDQVAEAVGRRAAERPVVLTFDDLQWADPASLRLFAHLAHRLPAGTVLVGALRDCAPVPDGELTRTLATVSRAAHHRRIRLGPLDREGVAELVRQETGRDPAPGAARVVQGRTAGNAFLARELCGLLDGAVTPQAAARAGVPAGVRDVVRDRLSGLDARAVDAVRVAALTRRDVEIVVLARAAGVAVPDCLTSLEQAEGVGLLRPGRDDPFTTGFRHALVRDAVARLMSPWQASRTHSRIAQALEETHRGRERISHHRRAAGPLAARAGT